MEWVITVLGVGLVVVVVRDVFHTLFHPIGHGSIAPQVMKLVWRLLRLFPSDRPDRIADRSAGHHGSHHHLGCDRCPRLDADLLPADAERSVLQF